MFAVRRVLVVGVASTALILASCGGDDGGGGLVAGANDGGAKSSEFCQKAQKVEDMTTSAFTSTEPDALKKGYNDLIDAAEDAVKAAPSSIKSALQDQLEQAKKIKELGDKHDWDSEAMGADPEFQALINAEDPNEGAVEAFLASECGIGSGDTESNGETPTLPGGTDTNELIAQSITQALPGVTIEQARCLVAAGLNIGDLATPAQIKDKIEACGIDPADVGLPG